MTYLILSGSESGTLKFVSHLFLKDLTVVCAAERGLFVRTSSSEKDGPPERPAHPPCDGRTLERERPWPWETSVVIRRQKSIHTCFKCIYMLTISIRGNPVRTQEGRIWHRIRYSRLKTTYQKKRGERLIKDNFKGNNFLSSAALKFLCNCLATLALYF